VKFNDDEVGRRKQRWVENEERFAKATGVAIKLGPRGRKMAKRLNEDQVFAFFTIEKMRRASVRQGRVEMVGGRASINI